MPLTGISFSGSLYSATGSHFPSSPNVIGVDGPGRLARVQKIGHEGGLSIWGERSPIIKGEPDLST